jgi:hypothetical protein
MGAILDPRNFAERRDGENIWNSPPERIEDSGSGVSISWPWEPVALVEFLRIYAKIPDYRGSADLRFDCGLRGIKIHFREFLYDFALKRDKPLGEVVPKPGWRRPKV